ncbi:MAG: hypothetical protein JJ902_05585 [Roseibium sp.]|nr:hypothetical protein [Roseibium sp.]
MFPKSQRRVTHERTLELYRAGLITAGLVRHLASRDEILSLKADKAGVPSKDTLDTEMK